MVAVPSTRSSSRSGLSQACCLWFLFCITLSIAGCHLGPNYQKPDFPAPGAWQHTQKQNAESPDLAAWPSADWWKGFASPQLDALLAQARSTNDDIAASIARVHEADALARIAGAPLLPSLSGGFEATHERGPVSGGGIKTYSLMSPTLNASYQLDFWGKNREARNAALATANASRFDHVTIELSVMSGVANTYFQILALRDRLNIAHKNLDTAQSILDGVTRQKTAGIANALDVAQQTTIVSSLYAAIPPLTQQLRQATNALAILVGSTPESLDVNTGSLADIAHPTVTPGLPSELLARRPDVAEAEAQLIAANANVAAARAAFFPSIGLTASGGYESNSLSNLLSPGNAIFSLAAALTQPIFEGGALQGQSDYTKARYTELLSSYHKTVITAFGNVEDALVAVEQTEEQERRQQQAADAANHAYEIAQAQLHAGTINILTLLNTESALFAAQDALAQVKFSHLQALVNLFSALGGGWQQAQGAS